uniref:Sesquiterpene synthase n=1 Tax=Oryza nivara TaxID=4536 RepID=A0A0E0HSH4_ORYNI
MKERVQVVKEEVRKVVKGSSEVPEILDLVITLQRLGLDSYYETEINDLLCIVYNTDYNDKDLHLVSLRFYLLRKNGYVVSSDMFQHFKDKEGSFVADDVRSLLSLYNAAFLRTHGEKVLDEAIVFTTNRLRSELEHLKSPAADEVSLALNTPLFRRVRILEIRNYIPIYESATTRNESILEFAKLNFNLLQLIYCEELKSITGWWKKLNVESNLSFIRDRIVEMHFWMIGACSEPHYSLSRIILTKMIAFITILDDIFDTYATTEESMMLAKAIYMCNETATVLLPKYMKDFYLYYLKTFDSFEEALCPNKSYRVCYLKELFKRLVQEFSQEIKWRDDHYIPKTIEEHLELSRKTVSAFELACASFVGMGDLVAKETLDCLLTYPELLKSFTTCVWLSNDIASTKREQAGDHHHASTIQSYMLQHGATAHEACVGIKELIEDSWKDMMKEYLTPTDLQPKIVARMKMSSTPAANFSNEDDERKAPTGFHPSLWGDFFISYQPPTAPKHAYMKERAEVLKEEVRKVVKGSNEVPEILDLVITLQRLGLDSYYKAEIDELLCTVYNTDYNDKDLHLVSLRFYLLRKNGYDVSSDIFQHFKDKEGSFVADDTRSLLSLYNAAYMRTHGEKVLDEAVAFTTNRLRSELKHLKSPVADEVSLALDTPLFRRVRIIETQNYIPIYESATTRNEAILEFAKLNVNLLQLIYCEELKTITRWWKELNVESNLSFIRDRIVEMHFWMTGACSEPHYSLLRIILTKMTAFITILDDIFDTYATTEESMMLAKAIYMCNESATVLLPKYMKDFYLYYLKTFDSFEEALGPNKSYRVFYLKELFKILIKGYSEEIKWRDDHYIPKTIEEHLELSRTTVGAFQLACASLVGMGDFITEDTLDYLLTYPKLLKSYTTCVRLSNDIASTKREQAGDHYASTIQCYMLQHGTTIHEACIGIKELIEDSWKDMMKEYLAPTNLQAKIVARTVIDFARTGDYIYKQADSFTFSHTIKDMIASLYVFAAVECLFEILRRLPGGCERGTSTCVSRSWFVMEDDELSANITDGSRINVPFELPVTAVCSEKEDNERMQKAASTFHPTLWGDFFVDYQPPNKSQHACMKERAEVLKEEVRCMVKGSKEVSEILDLVLTLQRLGLDSYYKTELDDLLYSIYNSDFDDKDLNLVSLRFYLLRKNGYDVSSDIFLCFKDKEGSFAADEVRSLLGLYNAAHVRTRGDKVLDGAIAFTKSHLEAKLEHLKSPLKEEVSSALETPLFRRVRILETRNYIPIYEKISGRNETILEFAKLNFNLLQLLYCEELKKITLWWKELNIQSNLSFIRDRIVEMHFWMTGVCPEFNYSLSRIILTKMMAYITIIDDIFDTHGTTEESMMLAEAIYKLVQGYSQEIKWRDEHYVPKTVDEHLEVSRATVGAFEIACASFVVMGDIITKETLDWLLTYPELLKCFTTLARLSNDIVSTKREQKGEHHVSTVQCYMFQHGTTMHDACVKIKELIEDSWKDIVKEYLTLPTEQPKIVAETIVDLARTADYMYKKTDSYTFANTIKDMVASLYVKPI